MAGDVSVIVDVTKLQKLLRHIAGTPARILYDGTEYGKYLEFGTSRMAARPFMGPAVEKARQDMADGWDQVIERQLMTPDDFVERVARDAETMAKRDAPYRTGNLKNSIGICKPDEFTPR